MAILKAKKQPGVTNREWLPLISWYQSWRWWQTRLLAARHGLAKEVSMSLTIKLSLILYFDEKDYIVYKL